MMKILTSLDRKFLRDKIRVYDEGAEIMLAKTQVFNIYIDELDNRAANILKQDALSLGGDLAVHADVVRFLPGKNACVLMATKKQIFGIIQKSKIQPFGLKELGEELALTIANYESKNYVLELASGQVLGLSSTKIMGIFNVTPDSFFDGTSEKYLDLKFIEQKLDEMVENEVDIIDIGAESTRPGATPISLDEELKRILPALKLVRKKTKIPISIDTYKSEVARQCIEEGADIINDISSFNLDEMMTEIAIKYNVPIILNHMQNTPQNMQENPVYFDVISEILAFFAHKIEILKKFGIKQNKIVVDPGIGFGKTIVHNFEILKNIEEFRVLGKPILLGTSRKGFINKTLGLDKTNNLSANLAISSYLCEKGVNILRVHDVKENKQICKLLENLK